MFVVENCGLNLMVWTITWTVKNEMQVVEVLNPLARDFKSVGNLRKELAGLQEDLAKAHNQVCSFHWEIPTKNFALSSAT